jgi:hypothetical protein
MTKAKSRLAGLISEELERDSWGTIDPLWFKAIANGENPDDYNDEDAVAICDLDGLLVRVEHKLLNLLDEGH